MSLLESQSDGTARKPFVQRLFDPVDGASIAIFRLACGMIFFWEVTRYFANGWIARYFIEPSYNFHYEGFSWVKPWEGEGMYWHFVFQGIFALGMGLGCFYRFSAVMHLLLMTAFYLFEQAKYLNHIYLAILFNFMLCFMPCNRTLSVDAWLFPKLRQLLGWKWLEPDTPSDTVPYWSVWALRTQLGLVYFYAAVAKMNADWMFHGEPVGDWLDARGDYVFLWDKFPIGDWVFDEPWAGMVFAWGGLMIDLLAWPLLLWRRTRVFMYLSLLFFHCMNKWLFNIGIFPVMALATTTIFFEPDWPRRIKLFLAPKENMIIAKDAVVDALRPRQKALLVGLGIYMAYQVLFPLRHFLYPGTVHWTEEGHRYAWHMKLRDKDGRATFFIHHPQTEVTWEVGPTRMTRSDGEAVPREFRRGLRSMLTSRQIRKMTTRPYMLHQFVQHLDGMWAEMGYEDVEIKVNNECRLNMRPWQTLIDPSVDLTEAKHNIWRKDWILPLETDFRPVADDDDDDDGVSAGELEDMNRKLGRVDDD